MENEIRLVLLMIGMVIIAAVWWDGLRRAKRQKSDVGRKQRSRFLPDHDFFAQEPQLATEQAQVLDQVEPEAQAKLVQEPVYEPFEAVIEEPQEINAAQQTENELVSAPEEAFEISDEAHAEPQAEIFEEALEETVIEKAKPKTNRLVMFSVMASGNKVFGGFKLLQVLLNHHFHFGDMQIFHFFDDEEGSGKKLFSLAAATETGEFDLANMANFTCKGLVLFMNTKDHEDAAEVFDEMVIVTEALAKDLGADLKVNHDEPWTEENLGKIYQGL